MRSAFPREVAMALVGKPWSLRRVEGIRWSVVAERTHANEGIAAKDSPDPCEYSAIGREG